MILNQPRFHGRFLCIGRTSDLPAFSRLILAPDTHTVCATATRLSELNEDPADIARRHDFVLFESDAADEDIQALRTLAEATSDRTAFIALTDGDLPMSRARRLMEAGARDVLPASVDSEALAAVLEKLSTPEDTDTSTGKAGLVVPVIQARGGAGATTVAVNLATALVKSRRKPKSDGPRVLLLDLDLQFGTAGTYLDVEDNGALLELLTRADPPSRQEVLAAAQSTSLGMDVVTAPTIFVPLSSMTPELARHLISVYRSTYDVVIVDMPRATLDWIEPVIAEAGHLIMVSEASVPCVRHGKRILDLVRESNVSLPVSLVMNRESKPLFAPPMLKEAEAVLGLRIAAWLPDDPRHERRAIDLGRPSCAGRGAGRRIYRRIARELISSSHPTKKGDAS